MISAMISAILRLVVGLGILGFTVFFYKTNRTALLSDSQTVMLFDQDFGLSGQMVLIGLGVFAVIGLLLVIFGLVGLIWKSS